MKTILFFAVFLLAETSFCKPAPAPARPAAPIRTFLNCPDLPHESLRSGVSLKFYNSLKISPLEAWIVVRAPLNESKGHSATVSRSDAGGVYDSFALQLANSMQITGMNYTESNLHISYIDVHLLIYKIADGVMVVGFSHIDDPRYAGYKQFGRATIGFLRHGQWTFMDNKMERR
ncbi:MAG: hypothetical protein ACR2ID_04250 [Chthoniobacterales bacterium]